MKIAAWIAILSLAIVLASVVALWRIFEKAGAPGWASLIPLYNMHVLYKLCWEAKFFWFQILLSIAARVLQGVDDTGMLTAFGAMLSLAAVIMGLMLPFRLAKAFGKSKLFGLGLLIFNTIHLLILGFGSAEYVGSRVTSMEE